MYLNSSFIKKPHCCVISDDENVVSAPHPKETTTQGLLPLSDKDLSEIEETPKLTVKDRLHDINVYFDEPAKVKDSTKPKWRCKICRYTISIVFLIYYCSTYVLNIGKRELSRQLSVKLLPSINILRLSTLYAECSLLITNSFLY